MSWKRVVAAIGLSMLLSACWVTSSEFAPYTKLPAGKWKDLERPSQTDEQRAMEQAWLGQDRTPDWGIALSGGGLRAALYSVGALKALYDGGYLQRAEYISAVSGGGYAMYWLYRNETRAAPPAGRFGSSTFAKSEFLKRVCNLTRKANFVSYGSMLGALRPGFKGRSRDLYQRSILRTFGDFSVGKREPLRPVLPIWTLPKGNGTIPMPIVNATIYDEEQWGAWRSRLFEFTPLQYGNDVVTYRSWNRSDTAEPGWYRLAAISGAAAEILTDRFVSAPGENPPFEVPLYDGGKSENLGAIALIRRKVPNILIIDAEYDPRHQFGGYIRLKEQLSSNYGWKLSVPLIDQGHFPSNLADWDRSSFIGKVTDGEGRRISNIYYQKMAVSRYVGMLFDEFGRKQSDGAAQDRLYDKHYAKAGCSGGVDIDLPVWAAYVGGSYKGYLERRRLSQAISALPFAGTKHYFPHYTTADQSFYLDQAKAFIAIGYLNGREMTKKLLSHGD